MYTAREGDLYMNSIMWFPPSAKPRGPPTKNPGPPPQPGRPGTGPFPPRMQQPPPGPPRPGMPVTGPPPPGPPMAFAREFTSSLFRLTLLRSCLCGGTDGTRDPGDGVNLYLTLFCHNQDSRCRDMAGTVTHFLLVFFWVVESGDTKQCSLAESFEGNWGTGDLNLGQSAYQPSTLPQGWAGPFFSVSVRAFGHAIFNLRKQVRTVPHLGSPREWEPMLHPSTVSLSWWISSTEWSALYFRK